MSDFISWWIITIVLINIFGCFWIIRWTAKPRPNEAAKGTGTGHVWDGDLTELNNPMPSWWLNMFYITLVFSLGYLILYPGLGKYQGLLGWSGVSQYETEMSAAKAKYDPIFQAYAQQDIRELSTDAEALKIGQRLFLNYCASCHGSTATGARGFPNLADTDWLYGGDPAMIKTSILHGRNGMMPAMGAALGKDGVEQVANYVLSLSGRDVNTTLGSQGKVKFETFCGGCHMPQGTGNVMIGAPNLTDKVWLYGGSIGIVKQTISEGRNGNMPAHAEFLGEDKVHLLAAYVYSLSNQ